MKNSNERLIALIVITTGVSSVVTQLLVIREFLSLFQGNEFVISLILFNWLLLGGIGTLLARTAGKGAGRTRLSAISLLLAGLSPLELYAIRELRDLFFLHGASLGFFPTFVYTCATVVPYCLLLGFALPYSLSTAVRLIPDYPGTRIYIADNIGDAAGGALFSFVLVLYCTPFQAVFAANLPLVIAAFALMPAKRRRSTVFLAGLAACMAALLLGLVMERPSLSPEQGKLAYYEESRYGRIAVHQAGAQHTLFLDGTPIFSSENTALAEETVHYPLSQIREAGKILLISAEGGVMEEIQKYSPKRVDYVEIDPRLTEVQFRFGLLKKIGPLNVINRDGRAFLKHTDKRYDAIILALPEPDTFQLNRFYTKRFFELAKSRLQPGGILSFSTEGIENYLAKPQQQKISSLYRTAGQNFRHVLMLPGQRIFFLCTDGPIQTNIPELLQEKGIRTTYIAGYYHGNLTQTRINRINDEVLPDAPVNRDYAPRMIRIMFSEWFTQYASSPTLFIVLLAGLCLIYFLMITREEFVLFSTGCLTMGSEILVIFAFQVFFGYIYYQIGLIVTVFLAGLLPGALFGEHLRKRGLQVLLITDAALILFLLIFIAGVFTIGDHLPHGSFLVFGFLVSAACGCQFPIALYLRGSNQKAAVQSFSADLIGAAAGTLVTSVVLIPYAGILWTALALAAVKAASLVLVRSSHDIHIAA
ncbi:MAG TPA: hypothetical protein VKO20_06380 [Desulfosalsimonadaceae bacterium]|nr:hypothetical protein [Desulfosalsimonadaceae bacterium]